MKKIAVKDMKLTIKGSIGPNHPGLAEFAKLAVEYGIRKGYLPDPITGRYAREDQL